MPGKDADLDFGHIEPTGVFGCVVKLQFLHQTTCLVRRKGFVESTAHMGVEVVQDKANTPCSRELNVDQCANDLGPLLFGALFGHNHPSPSDLGLAENKEIADTIAYVFVVLQLGLTGLGWQGGTT